MVLFDKKSEGLDCETWNFSWRQSRSILRKHLKIIFSQHSFSLWKCNLKYTNIYHYLFIATNIWFAVLQLVFNSSLQPDWIETDNIVIHPSAVGCDQLVPKYISKVKLDRWKSLISIFTKEWPHSAMVTDKTLFTGIKFVLITSDQIFNLLNLFDLYIFFDFSIILECWKKRNTFRK